MKNRVNFIDRISLFLDTSSFLSSINPYKITPIDNCHEDGQYFYTVPHKFVYGCDLLTRYRYNNSLTFPIKIHPNDVFFYSPKQFLTSSFLIAFLGITIGEVESKAAGGGRLLCSSYNDNYSINLYPLQLLREIPCLAASLLIFFSLRIEKSILKTNNVILRACTLVGRSFVEFWVFITQTVFRSITFFEKKTPIILYQYVKEGKKKLRFFQDLFL